MHVEGLWPPCIERICGHHFPSGTGSGRVSVTVSRSVSDFFVFVMGMSDLGCYYCKRLQLAEGSDDGQHFLAIKYFLIKPCILSS